jgi:hypothetical protein
MTPSAITAEAEKAGLKNLDLPTCDVAGDSIDTGSEAQCFSQYMNVHALEATGGAVYSEMGRYAAKPGTPETQLASGGGTNNPRVRAGRSEDEAARRQRGAERLGDRNRARDRAQRELHGLCSVALQSRRRDRAPTRRRRLHRAGPGCATKRIDRGGGRVVLPRIEGGKLCRTR